MKDLINQDDSIEELALDAYHSDTALFNPLWSTSIPCTCKTSWILLYPIKKLVILLSFWKVSWEKKKCIPNQFMHRLGPNVVQGSQNMPKNAVITDTSLQGQRLDIK